MEDKRTIYLSNFIFPKKLEVDTLEGNYGKFILEPLEKGFGITLGNSLRRTLLSGIQGTAFTSVRIQGVHHEFSTIPGVLEDVVEIILNLKDVILAFDHREQVNLKIEAKVLILLKGLT